eukprot:3383763-Prymnesium_polylepis.1
MGQRKAATGPQRLPKGRGHRTIAAPGLPHRVCPGQPPTGRVAHPYRLAFSCVAFQLSGPGGRLPWARVSRNYWGNLGT